MNSPGLSVLTLVKHRSVHLSRLIEGLRRSERVPEELVVVDMGGGWVAPAGTRFPIRVIDMPSAGLPLARARNAAAAAAHSEHLLFLDVDCIPMRRLLAAMSAHLACTDAIVCAEVRYLGPGELTTAWDEESLLAVAESHPVRPFPLSGLRQAPNPGLFWSLTFGIHRSTFLELGGFDETFTGYGAEDTDFGFRAHRRGTIIYFAAGPGTFHQHHSVFDPPLQHFFDIVANAATFHRRWNVWPMEDWLRRFESLGLIEMSQSAINVVRGPTREEVATAEKHARF